MGMGRNREIGKGNARLCKMDFLLEIFYPAIHNKYKRVGDGKIKRVRFKSEEIELGWVEQEK